ncbi:hypothetical protein [Ferrovibrio sp.]|jgi:hypothetical protein
MRDLYLILLAAIIASLPFMVLGAHIHRPAQQLAAGMAPGVVSR